MKREPRTLLSKATDSALLAVEHFNRPWDRGRPEAVLILLDRAFELVLKAVIVEKGGKIRERRAKETIGFDSCVRKCVSDEQVKCLTEEQAVTIQILNGLRDAAQHYFVDISEQQLYLYTQSSLTLFDAILKRVFGRKLTDYLPDRVLPISADPPKDIGTLMAVELDHIKELVAPGSRKNIQARAKLRPLAIVEDSLSGVRSQPSESELARIAARVRRGDTWQQIFPGIRRLTVDADGGGLSVTLRITKAEGEPIHMVPEGTPGAAVVAVRRVDELGFYSLSATELAHKAGLSMPKTIAVVRALELQESSEYFKEFAIGSSTFKRYSPKALDQIKRLLPSLDLDVVWRKYGPRR
jgi:Domain of unknown function (DUF3644)